MNPFLITTVFVLTTIVAVIYTYIQNRKQKRQIADRLDELTNPHHTHQKLGSLQSITDKIDQQLMKIPLTSKLVAKTAGEKRRSEIKPAHLVLINVAVIVIAFNLSNIININPVMLMLFLAAGEGAGLIYAARNQKKVKDLVEAELPQILETMGRVYKVHPDLRVAISEVCKHIKEPLVRERLESIVRLSRFGYTTEEAISVISKELKSSDLDFVVTSIQLNTPLGGNLSGLFERMADILRKRKNTDNEINNVMFQNKISAIISAAFVPFIICLAFVTSENSKKFLIADSTGRLIFFACIIWWLIGVFLIRRVTRIKI